MKKFSVEIQRNLFVTVVAKSVVFSEGTAVFYSDYDNLEVLIAYAPGQWLTVTVE